MMKDKNKNKKRAGWVSLLAAMLAVVSPVNGQNELPTYVPASPTVSSLIAYADYPVSYYTGIPEISIPLYEIEVDGYKFPISLSYHASGIRVAQEASWVGLGWSLNVGGVISRTLKCYDDFNEYTYPGIFVKSGYYTGPEVSNPELSSLYTTTMEGSAVKKVLVVDSEPDVFSFTYPGASGKFLLDKNRGAVLLDWDPNVKIEVLADGSKKYFKLTAPDGCLYVFQDYEVTSSYHRSGSLNRNLGTKYDENNLNLYESPVKFTSSWYLSQIITPTNRTIRFTYAKESYQSPAQEQCKAYETLDSSGTTGCGPEASVQFTCDKTVVESLRLSGISWDGGSISFTCGSREDVRGSGTAGAPQKLNSLKVSDSSGNRVKEYAFGYGYFNSSYTGDYPHVFKRLKLNSLTDVAVPDYGYDFSYLEDKTMPAKNSRNTDYWGYWNGKVYGDTYYSAANYGGKVYSGVSKDAVSEFADTYMLSKIISPTGNETDFTYESNTYISGSSTGTTVTQETRNLMAYKYVNDDFYENYPRTDTETITLGKSTNVRITGWADCMTSQGDTSIRYDDADNYPVFRLTNSKGEVLLAYGMPGELQSGGGSYDYPVKTLYLTAGTYKLELIAQAADVLYGFTAQYESTVTQTGSVKEGGGLRIKQIRTDARTRTFSYPTGKLLIEPSLYYLKDYVCLDGTSSTSRTSYLVQLSESCIPLSTLKHGYMVGYDNVTENVGYGKTLYRYFNSQESSLGDYPFMPTSVNYMNGLPSSVETYNGSGSLDKEVTYSYGNQTSQAVYGFMFDSEASAVHPYSYTVKQYYKTGEVSKDYRGGASVYTDSRFEYNGDKQLAEEETLVSSSSSSADSYGRKYVYAGDKSDAVSRKMQNLHLIGVPLETLLLKDGKVTEGTRLEYTDTLGIVVPKALYTLEATAPLSVSSYQGSFKPHTWLSNLTDNGKPMSAVSRGQETVYLWSYNGQRLVAEIRNASYAEVKSKLGESFIKSLYTKNAPSSSDWTKVDGLRSSLPDAEVTTYVYSPLVGVTQVTDPKGFVTGYTYDTGGRLSEVFIKNGSTKQLVECYDYHYNR